PRRSGVAAARARLPAPDPRPHPPPCPARAPRRRPGLRALGAARLVRVGRCAGVRRERMPGGKTLGREGLNKVDPNVRMAANGRLLPLALTFEFRQDPTE